MVSTPAVLVLTDDLAHGSIALSLVERVWQTLMLDHALHALGDRSLAAGPPTGTGTIVLCGVELSDATIPSWLRAFQGPIYAVSVGISHASALSDLEVFDHIFVRTQADYLAAIALGTDKANVTRMDDIGYAVICKESSAITMGRPTYLSAPLRSGRPLLGFCISSACESCAFEQQLVLASRLAEVFEVCLLAFDPDDLMWNIQLAERNKRLHVIDAPELWDPITMSRLISLMSGVVTMHYTAALFALKVGLPCIAHHPGLAMVKMPGIVTLDDIAPEVVADRIIAYMRERRYGNVVGAVPVGQPLEALSQIKAAIYLQRRKAIRVPVVSVRRAGVREHLSQLLASYLGVGASVAEEWLDTPASSAAKRELIQACGKVDVEVARMFGFAVTRQVGVRLLGELTQRIFSSGPAPLEAAEWLAHQFDVQPAAPPVEEAGLLYCPDVPVRMQTVVDLSYIDQHDCEGLHRCGWAWVLKGLHRFDGRATGRTPGLKLDAYLDRTMLWGYETLKAAGVIPYTAPWAGFIHHTFTSGVESMFGRPLFLESLPHCRCLFVLSEYAAAQVRQALAGRGHGSVKVQVVRHPMQMLPSTKMFNLSSFLHNPERKLVQIGAWLRNTWSIFQLGISKRHGDFTVKKCALIGLGMEGYYKPPLLMDRLEGVLAKRSDDTTTDELGGLGDAMCREQRASSSYSEGMLDMLKSMDESVDLLQHMSNDQYDQLLGGPSEAVVFLHMKDASAVNTVIECMLRGTPVIVNRTPALEEVLGPTYPGFYEDLVQAADMATSLSTIAKAHQHLLALPKDNLRLDRFLEVVQQALAEVVHGAVS